MNRNAEVLVPKLPVSNIDYPLWDDSLDSSLFQFLFQKFKKKMQNHNDVEFKALQFGLKKTQKRLNIQAYSVILLFQF